MASLPARQPSQRRTSPTEQSQTSSNQSHATSPVRTRSEDSQTIFVNSTDEDQQQQDTSRHLPQPPQIDDPSVKKCWICFEDSTEDTPETSPWRDPCPCALVAHEGCLLDWIADMEAPKNNRNRGIAAPKIECPQCKSEIKLSRPKDYLVDVVRGLERLGNKAVVPGAISVLGTSLYHTMMLHGMHSIYAVFGADDGYRILQPLLLNSVRPPVEVYMDAPVNASQQLMKLILDHMVHWRLYVGIPLITPILVVSRTSFADGILPVLPIIFFASQAHSPEDALDFAQWPPSASFAFAVLPYIRSLYNFYYQKVWAEKEKQWLKEIQPRTGQNENDDGANADLNGNQNQRQERAQDENVFEVRIDGGMWDDWEDEQQLEDLAANNAPIQPQQGREEDEAAPGPNVQDNRPLPQGGANEQPQVIQQNPPIGQPQQQNQQNQQNAQQVDRRISFSPTAIAETVLGAIAFPTLAGLAGEALKLVLPRSWTTPPAAASMWNRYPLAKGFLQQKWARSIIGGCLLVVCKDALMLYVRWKMAQMHRGRRVVDFDRRKGNSKRAAT